jgi:hypothetical protein
LARVVINGLYGYIDREGRLVIPPQFESARNFSEGRAEVRLANGTYGQIDKTGHFSPNRPNFKERLNAWRVGHGVFSGGSIE